MSDPSLYEAGDIEVDPLRAKVAQLEIKLGDYRDAARENRSELMALRAELALVHQPIAFAALEAIEAGSWDRWLHRFKGAVATRAATEEYQASIIAGS